MSGFDEKLYTTQEYEQDDNISVLHAAWVLISLSVLYMLVWIAQMFRIWRYEEDEYGMPIRRQNRFTGRIELRTRDGWIRE